MLEDFLDFPVTHKMRAFVWSSSGGEMAPLLQRRTDSCCYFPRRFVFSTVAFLACSLAVSFNMNLSIAIVSMVNRTELLPPMSNTTLFQELETTEQPIRQFNWSADIQSAALGAVYYGQLVSFIPGGRAAELYGGKRTLIVCTLLASVFTAISPVAAYISEYLFIASRFFVGLGTGPVIPVVFCMLSHWIPVTERSFHASFIISGYGVGSFLAVLVSGAICGCPPIGGWPSVFYIGGSCGILWCVMAFFMMHELPSDDPAIRPDELYYIRDGLENDTQQIRNIPWKQMFMSVPFWALAVGFFGQFWLLGFFSTVHAVYMGIVLELPVATNGVLSCLPHLLRAIATCLASYPADILLKRGLVSVGFVRKGATVINTVVSCLAFLGITLVGRDTTATTLLFVAGGILGEFVTFGVCMACVDIAPGLSGTVSGIINIVGVFPFFTVPALAGWITNYEKSIDKWKKVFYTTIAVAAISTLIFVVLGDLRPQPWGTPSPAEGKDENEESDTRHAKLEEQPLLLKQLR